MAKAVIAGASGLIGSYLVDMILQSTVYQNVTILVRKELPLNHPKLKQIVVDFDHLDQHQSEINGHVLFCCLGTTRKKTPDREVYRKIDHDYPLQLAQIAKKNCMAHYHLVSALGANASSSIFYTRLKGEVEADIERVDMPSLHIYRPSLLTGARSEDRKEERFMAALMKFVNLFLWGSLCKYRSIPAETVARAMCKQSLLKQEGVFIHPSDQIKEIS